MNAFLADSSLTSVAAPDTSWAFDPTRPTEETPAKAEPGFLDKFMAWTGKFSIDTPVGKLDTTTGAFHYTSPGTPATSAPVNSGNIFSKVPVWAYVAGGGLLIFAMMRK